MTQDNSINNNIAKGVSANNNKKLGRGIASLLAMNDIDFDINTVDNVSKAIKPNSDGIGGLAEININDIVPNPNQPRKFFDNNKLKELSESIKNSGLLQPIIVSTSKTNNNKYIIIAGERRYRASKLAGLDKIKAIILDLKEQEILKNAILENVQREDLNPVEEASGYKKIIDTFGYTHEQLAHEIGKSRAHITNLLRILTLPDEVQSALRNNNITLGHAKVLLSVENPSAYLPVVVEKQLSVRQLEKMVANGDVEFDDTKNEKSNGNDAQEYNTANITFEMIKQLYSPISSPAVENAENTDKDNKQLDTSKLKNKLSDATDAEWQQVTQNIKIIEQQLSESCGFNVRLVLKPEGNGKIEIDFANAEDLLELVKMF